MSSANSFPDVRFIEYARGLLDAARHDLTVSKLLWDKKIEPLALFHLQQAAEKMVKALSSMYQFIFVELASYIIENIIDELMKNSNNTVLNFYLDENTKNSVETLLELLRLRVGDLRISIKDFENKLKKEYSHEVANGITKDLKRMKDELKYFIGVLKVLFAVLGLSRANIYIDKFTNWVENELLSPNIVSLSGSSRDFAQDVDKMNRGLQLVDTLADAFNECISKMPEKLSKLKFLSTNQTDLLNKWNKVDNRIFDLIISITIFIFYVSKIAKELSYVEQTSRYPTIDNKSNNILTPSDSVKGIVALSIYEKVHSLLNKILEEYLNKAIDYIYEKYQKLNKLMSDLKQMLNFLAWLSYLSRSYMVSAKYNNEINAKATDITSRIDKMIEDIFNLSFDTYESKTLTELLCDKIDINLSELDSILGVLLQDLLGTINKIIRSLNIGNSQS